jgi:hypothetical protein
MHRPSAIHVSFVLGAFFGAGVTAQADVTIREATRVEGAGVMRMANMSGTSETTISGNRARMAADMKMESRMVRMFARGMGPTADIILLDEDKAYELDVKKKQYREVSLAERRAQMAQATEQAAKAQPPIGGVDQSQCEWLEPRADVKRTGEKGNFAGFDAERVTINATQSCRDRNTGSVCDFTLMLDQWVAPKFAASDELTKFYTSYAQKMGLDAAAAQGGQRAESMFSRYKGVWSQVAAKMRDVKGYPVKSSFAMAVGGPQCKSGEAQAAQSGESPSAGGGIAGRLAGALMNRNKPAEGPPAATPAGLVPLLTVHSEIVSVSGDSAPAGTFDVPADYKKVAAAN